MSARARPVRILVLNQFLPPDPAPTARLLGELADELERRGHLVDRVGDRADYHGSKTLFGSRALREGLSLARILVRALLAPKADAVLCLTSPPLLLVVGRMARLRHRRARLLHWAMDLYPDVAVALGELREGSWLHRLSARAMRGAYGACELVVALDEEMARRIGLANARTFVEAPWPPAIEPNIDGSNPDRADTFVWLYSGNLGRAHEWRDLLAAQARLEAQGLRIDLIFQGDGTERTAVEAEAGRLGLKRCHWRPYAASAELLPSLLAADALVATQRPETAGCLWPSKLALLRELDRPIVWIGPRDGSIAANLRAQGHGTFTPGEDLALAEHLAKLVRQRRARQPSSGEGRQAAERLAAVRAEAISRLADRIEAAALPQKRR